MVVDRSTDDVIRLEVELAASSESVWQFLTEKEHLSVWWGDHVMLQARPAGAFVERWSDGRRDIVTAGVVMRSEAPFRLEWTWSDHDWPGATKVSIELSQEGDRTRLELVHSGWDVHPAGVRREMMSAHMHGWSSHLGHLRDYVAATGKSSQTIRSLGDNLKG